MLAAEVDKKVKKGGDHTDTQSNSESEAEKEETNTAQKEKA